MELGYYYDKKFGWFVLVFWDDEFGVFGLILVGGFIDYFW